MNVGFQGRTPNSTDEGALELQDSRQVKPKSRVAVAF